MLLLTLSPHFTSAAMKPYVESHKIAGIIGIIADKTGKGVS
ncbi:MAG TPA: hypothetical protein VGH19_04410 [Verrucomicrobiae bacterium]